MDLSLEIEDVTPYVFRVPIEVPVITSFGEMRDRPALFLRVTTADGHEGWGEVWCNFPSVGAEHRARLIATVLAPLCRSRGFESPHAVFRELTGKTEILAIQSGEPGPLAQILAGLDIALWDATAKRNGRPLYRMFREEEVQKVPVYASGLNPEGAEVLAREKFSEGHRRFKLKVGFGRERDTRNLIALREQFGPDITLMADANQAWTLETAIEMSRAMEGLSLEWLEEPLRATAPLSDWRHLAESSPVPLALGENLRGEETFARIVREGGIGFLQPDIGKWGGFSGCVEVGRDALQSGVTLCPHWLGGGIGLVASLHFLAAVGGDGVLEVDSNPNPLRDRLVRGMPAVEDGDMRVSSKPGLGVEPDLDSLVPYRVDL